MAKDIEEFLRMAAKRRQEQKQAGQGRQPETRPPREKKPAPQQSTPRKPAPQQPAPEVGRLANRPGILRGENVAEHVQEHINTRELQQHAEHLGNEHLAEVVESIDDRMQSHVREVFDHDVSTLREQRPDAATVSIGYHNALAADLVRMLSNPKSVRQAILLQEIMKRPDFD